MMVVTFIPDGTARALYDETIDLRELGRMTVERASMVEFDERKQVWEVRLLDGTLVHENASREECLRWEKENL